MNFQSFAAEHGLVIDHLISGRWVRCPTVDHPSKKNGAYIFSGDSGAIQNWATHEKPIPWRDKHATYDAAKVLRDIKNAEAEKAEKQANAARKAAWIMKNATCEHHPYLLTKGFPKEKGWVWKDKLVIPMRVDGSLVGCQLIDSEGVKHFLKGQRTRGACAGFDTKGKRILCEGYATALSVRAALKHAKLRYNIIVCFSVGNMAEMAAQGDCVLIADHDASKNGMEGAGQRAAKKSGRPYWISPIVGEDFNDYMNRVGLDEASLVISALVG